MDTVAFAIILLTQLLPGETQIDTIYVSNISEKPLVFSRKIFSKENGRSIYFEQILTDTAVHYVDYKRRIKSIQPISGWSSDLGIGDKHLYQFNGGNYITIDSVQLLRVDEHASDLSLYTNVFYHTDNYFSGSASHIFSYETGILCFEDIPLSVLMSLSAIRDLQFVVDRYNRPIVTGSSYLVGLVVTARYTGYQSDPLSARYRESFSTTYQSLQSVKRIEGLPLIRTQVDDTANQSYQLVPFVSFFN